MVQLEVELVKAFHWSLAEIDGTDIETLFPFVFSFGGTQAAEREAYCDQVGWL